MLAILGINRVNEKNNFHLENIILMISLYTYIKSFIEEQNIKQTHCKAINHADML